jgi:DNA primase
MRIPDEIIDEVRAATNIVEVIGEYVPLVAAGRNYKGLCPFHEEKTPSFIVSPDRQTYHCFGCSAGGNVYSFLMKNQGLEFREALELLAGRAGITLPRAPEATRAAGEAGPGRLLAALEDATRFFEQNLWQREAGRRARGYLVERGIREDTARLFRLGYALPGFDSLRRRLGDAHGLTTLIAAGLLVDRGADRNYDRFRDRLVFPILGPGGHPVGFGARSMDGSEPKYLNSPETAVYHKREVLYGLQAARGTLARQGTAWIVEGYMDVLALHQAGFGAAVAVSGTALSERHARLLGRHTRQVLLLFDGDDAGRAAILRSLPSLLAEGLAVRVALIPGGDDPDSLVRKGGPAAVEGVVKQASSVVQFVVTLCYMARSKEEARAEALRELVHLGSFLPAGAALRLFSEDAARALGFAEPSLAREIAVARAARERQARIGVDRGPARDAGPIAGGTPRRGVAIGSGALAGRPGAGRSPRTGAAGGARGGALDRELLALALGRPELVRRMRTELESADFATPEHERLWVLLDTREKSNQSIRPADLIGPDVDDTLGNLITELAVDPTAGEEDALALANDLIARLRSRRHKVEIARLRELIREHEAAGRRDEIAPLLERVQHLIQSG